MKSTEVFYLHINGEQRGPYTFQHIRHLLNSGLIGEGTLYWREGLEQWQPVTHLVGRRKTRSRRWVRPMAIAAGVIALIFAVLLRIFGPITLDGWRESAQTEYTEEAAYWRARDFVRRKEGERGAVIQFLSFRTAEVKMQPPDTALAVVRGKVIEAKGAPRHAAWRVNLRFNDRRKEWTSLGIEEAPAAASLTQ